MKHRQRLYTKRWLVAVAIALLILPLFLYARLHWLRPPRTNLEMTLFQGIVYQRQARSTPRPYMFHIVTIDLTTPGIGVLVTPGKLTADAGETIARTTSEFVREFKLQLAINANYFSPFHEHSPWNFSPTSGERVNPLGQAISRGFSYSPAKAKWPVLCFEADNRAQIVESGECPVGTVQAVAGRHMVVTRGTSVIQGLDASNDKRPYPRMTVALDRQGEKLWLIAIDGKQLLYSEGVSLAELGKIVMDLGAYTALVLDGGGSTTLAIANRSGIQVLNAPIHTKLPMRERPVANHLGFFARLQDE